MKEYPMEKGQCLQQMVLGKQESHMQKNDSGPPTYHTKKKFKMCEKLKSDTGNHQNPRGEHSQEILQPQP